MRNFQKIKTIEDYKELDSPELVDIHTKPVPPNNTLMILRMLVRPKYGDWKIPLCLNFLKDTILLMAEYDQMQTGIQQSWCYITVRQGKIESIADDEWHFDGSSFRTDIIPERNYIYTNNHPTQYKIGQLHIPTDFDPIKHNLFSLAEYQFINKTIFTVNPLTWYLLSPFVLHRRPPMSENIYRTFYRICFTDIEGRDINNTPNPLLPTPFYGRDPVQSFRNKLKNYYNQSSLL
jgi:hypothetical protein